MALNKYSPQSDKIANLYRAAFYLAKGYKTTALEFLNKSGETFKGLKIKNKKDEIFWAEKILDRYLISK